MTEFSESFLGICSKLEAESIEVCQLAPSGCGVTAVVNVLVALKVIPPSHAANIDWSNCILRTRANDAPLPQYLASRSVAGCTGEDLVTSMKLITSANQLPRINGQFLSFQEICEKSSMFEFISDCCKKGDAVVGTFNLQLEGNDAWHHQLIYGVDTQLRLVYCTNPICSYTEAEINAYMSTPSVLLVRRRDIISRMTLGSDENMLLCDQSWELFNSQRWRQMQVLEQIENTLLFPDISHIAIPANYVGGVAVFSVDKGEPLTRDSGATTSEDCDLTILPLFADCNSTLPNQYDISSTEILTVHPRSKGDRVQLSNSSAACTASQGLEYIDASGRGLFADDIWPGSRIIADYLIANKALVAGKVVLELGAGAALPSLVAHKLGAALCCVTDYPDESVLANIVDVFHENGFDCTRFEDVNTNDCQSNGSTVLVSGLTWGDTASLTRLLDHTKLFLHAVTCSRHSLETLDPLSGTQPSSGLFDIIILAELLWKDTYHLHAALLATVAASLSMNGLALVAFGHRPTDSHLPCHDMEFLEMARSKYGLQVELLSTSVKYSDVGEKGLFEEFLYTLKYATLTVDNTR